MGKLTDDDLHHGCSRGRPPPLLFFLPLLLLSLLLSLSCSLVFNVNGKEDEGERGLMGFVRWSADMWGRVVCVTQQHLYVTCVGQIGRTVRQRRRTIRQCLTVSDRLTGYAGVSTDTPP